MFYEGLICQQQSKVDEESVSTLPLEDKIKSGFNSWLPSNFRKSETIYPTVNNHIYK